MLSDDYQYKAISVRTKYANFNKYKRVLLYKELTELANNSITNGNKIYMIYPY